MDCKEFKNKYQLFLDGELEESKFESFEQHINECKDCGRIIKFERHFHLTITRKVKTRTAPNELLKRIRTKLF